MKNIFITGTDTGVGKTLVSKLLIEHFVLKDEVVAPMKPVASGAIFKNNRLVNDDALALIKSANMAFDYSIVNPYVFQEPIAPHLAAAKNDVKIETAYLNSCHQTLSKEANRVIIEGAGGWQVPLTPSISMADWVSEKKWPVIMVVGLRLGCINHARLTVLDMITKHVNLVGWVANTIDSEIAESDAIVADLQSFINAPLLGEIPWLENELDAINFLSFSLLDVNQ